MAQAPLTLPAVDTVQVRLIMDNAIDLLVTGSEVARRLPLGPNPFDRPQPIAEHGFSALITVGCGERTGTILFDTGVSRTGILYNIDAMEIDARDIQAIVLSHGHADHAMGLPGLIDRLGPRSLRWSSTPTLTWSGGCSFRMGTRWPCRRRKNPTCGASISRSSKRSARRCW